MDKKEAIYIIGGLIEDEKEDCGKSNVFFQMEVEALKMALEALERS